MAFSKEVQVAALVACGRCCCLCHKFCGPKMELHHIIQKANGGDDSFENCIPLCFECHADMGKRDPHHPKGKGYSPEELRMHRDNWYHRKQASVSSKIPNSDKLLFNDICKVFQPLMYTLSEYRTHEGRFSVFQNQQTKPAFRRALSLLYPQLSAKRVLKHLGEIDAAYLGGGVQPLGNGQRLLDRFP